MQDERGLDILRLARSRPAERLLRRLRLIHILESGTAGTPNTLAGLLRVSRRTVFRDLALLADAGIRCTYDRKDNTYILRHGWREQSLEPLGGIMDGRGPRKARAATAPASESENESDIRTPRASRM